MGGMGTNMTDVQIRILARNAFRSMEAFECTARGFAAMNAVHRIALRFHGAFSRRDTRKVYTF